MAGQAETFSSTKKTEKVVCPLCQGTYEDPKLLPCLHVFCKQCLESHVTVRSAKSLEGLGESAESSNTFHPASEATRNYDEPRHIDPDQTVVVCPLCDTKVDLPVDQIPSCYFTRWLVERHTFRERLGQALKCDTDTSNKDSDTSVLRSTRCDNCKNTDEKVIEYCFICKEFQCNFCSLRHTRYPSFANHSRTQFNSPDEIIKLQQQQEDTCAKHAGEKVKMFCQSCKKPVCSDCVLCDHRGHYFVPITSEVVESQQQVLRSLESTISELKDKVDSARSIAQLERAALLRQQSESKQAIQSAFSDLQQSLELRKGYLEQQVEDRMHQPLAKAEKTIENTQHWSAGILRCSTYLSDVSQSSPLAVMCSMHLIREYVDLLSHKISHLQSMGESQHVSDSESCFTLTESISVLGEVCFQTPSLPNSPSSSELPVPANLPCSISFSGDECGTHVVVKALSPLCTKSESLPCVLGIPVRTIEGLAKPCGVSVGGQITVCELGAHRVSILDMLGQQLKSVGKEGLAKGHFLSPYGIAMYNDGRFIVSDLCNRIQVFSSNGKCTRVVGSKDSRAHEELKFKDPTGIAIGPQGFVYVCEGGSHSIKILNADLSFRASFGERGSQPGQLNYPSDVATDRHGNLYVADCRNHRIQIFSESGSFILQFGSRGSEAGCLDSPCSVCVDSAGFLYVSELRNHRVSVFNSSGDFMMAFGSKGSGLGQFQMPRGIAIDVNSLLYVSDFNNRRIQIFK